MSKVQVQITKSAKQDLKGIARWVMLHDSPSKAAELLRQLEEACNSLTSLPLRGHKLPEQEIIAYSDCLEIHQGPYRIIYHCKEKVVYIDAILDGRRDIQAVLSSRTLG